MGVIYNIHGNTCNDRIEDNDEKYVGMTRTSVHNRMLSHLRDQKGKKPSSPLHRHDMAKHDSQPQTYTTIVAAEKKIVKLYCTEALHIERQDRTLSINAKRKVGGVIVVWLYSEL